MQRSAIRHKRGLGAGQFGMVYLADYTSPQGTVQEVAVKMCRTDTTEEEQVRLLRLVQRLFFPVPLLGWQMGE